MNSPPLYLDNAATSWPKPPEVLAAMNGDYARLGASPGRSSHRMAREAEERIGLLRQRLCRFFGSQTAERVTFAYNSTDALNMLILGMVRPGMHIVTTVTEHNSVLRPLHHLQQQGLVTVDYAPVSRQGIVTARAIQSLLRPETGFVIVNHASNVTGLIQPLSEIGLLCRQNKVPFFVDASQSAGVLPIDMQAMHISALAFTGHKALLGPTGIGGLVLADDIEPVSRRFGGTGFDSRSLDHPAAWPFRLEAGTLNLAGVLGLAAGLDFIEKAGMETILSREQALAARLIGGLGTLKKVRIDYPQSGERVGVVSFSVKEMIADDVAEILDGDFDIAARAGLHCAPLLHQAMGSEKYGTVRFSLGPFNTGQQIDTAIDAVSQIAAD